MYGPDPYDRRGYGRGPMGNYGFGCDECCGPNLIPIVACLLLFLVYCLFIPGFAAPYWISLDTTAEDGNAGLWRRCSQATGAAEECVDQIDVDNQKDWMEATQALMCICLICLVLATALLVYWLCSYSRYFFVKCIFLCLFFLAFIVSLVGVIVYGANATDNNQYDFDWCFYLVDVATSIMLFVPILLLCVPSRESFPSFGYHDRFGFNYPRPPPRPYGPSPPPPRPAPMGPRPGYGMAEPIAHIYPSSLPRAKPYGGGYSGYPTMPYSSAY